MLFRQSKDRIKNLLESDRLSYKSNNNPSNNNLNNFNKSIPKCFGDRELDALSCSLNYMDIAYSIEPIVKGHIQVTPLRKGCLWDELETDEQLEVWHIIRELQGKVCDQGRKSNYLVLLEQRSLLTVHFLPLTEPILKSLLDSSIGEDQAVYTVLKELVQCECCTSGKENCSFCCENVLKAQVFGKGESFYLCQDHEPVASLHSLIIPQRHVEAFHDLHDSELRELSEMIEGLSTLFAEQVDNQTLLLIQKNGEVSGRSLSHIHFHVMPVAHQLLWDSLANIYAKVGSKKLNGKELEAARENMESALRLSASKFMIT